MALPTIDSPSAPLYRPQNLTGEGTNNLLLRSCGMIPSHPSYYGLQKCIGNRARIKKAKQRKHTRDIHYTNQPSVTVCLNDSNPHKLLAICDTSLNWRGTTPHRPKGKEARMLQAAAYAIHPTPAISSSNYSERLNNKNSIEDLFNGVNESKVVNACKNRNNYI